VVKIEPDPRRAVTKTALIQNDLEEGKGGREEGEKRGEIVEH